MVSFSPNFSRSRQAVKTNVTVACVNEGHQVGEDKIKTSILAKLRPRPPGQGSYLIAIPKEGVFFHVFRPRHARYALHPRDIP